MNILGKPDLGVQFLSECDSLKKLYLLPDMRKLFLLGFTTYVGFDSPISEENVLVEDSSKA